MMKNAGRKSLLGFFAPLLLFLVFTVLSFTVILLATKVYRDTTNSSVRAKNASTALSYVSQKIHAADAEDAIRVEEFDGVHALAITESLDDQKVITRIYYDQGALRELFLTEDVTPYKDFGEAILEIADFSVTPVSNRLLLLSCTDFDDQVEELLVSLKCNQ